MDADLLSSYNRWFDYDRNGFLDLYLINLCPEDSTQRIQLYRNLDGKRFVDVASEIGLADLLPPMSCRSSTDTWSEPSIGDFNDDGWPDIYQSVPFDNNVLLLNDGEGGFRDATNSEVDVNAETSPSFVGDIDNDGDLDIYQGIANLNAQKYRPFMFLNLGGAEFLDVADGVGLRNLSDAVRQGGGLIDIDNDTDLDLLIGEVPKVFLNDGNGSFIDRTEEANIALGQNFGYADYDNDGDPDLIFDSLHRHPGNDNHWLKIEPVGIASNRNGIGARLTATIGDLRLTREISGSRYEFEQGLIAHFGLGQHAAIDRLEIRWPSGRIDRIENIAADQKIRIFEGHTDYHQVVPSCWQTRLPDALPIGSTFERNITVRPALFTGDAIITRIAADLSEWGGQAEVPLRDNGDGTYSFATNFAVEGPPSRRTISVFVEQETSVGPHWIRLVKTIIAAPANDLVVLDDTQAEDWTISTRRNAEMSPFTDAVPVYSGQTAVSVETEDRGPPGWGVDFKPATPVELVGYETLQLAFHPGDSELGENQFLEIFIKGLHIFLARSGEEGLIDFSRREWQLVEIPLRDLLMQGTLRDFRLQGRVEGTFYLDDIRLVSQANIPSNATAVVESHTDILPESAALAQNYPNPFNSNTVIRFALPISQHVALEVFNLAGQKVATLASGMRNAGTYMIQWDGWNDAERPLATGVYLFRLRTSAGLVETRKMILLR